MKRKEKHIAACLFSFYLVLISNFGTCFTLYTLITSEQQHRHVNDKCITRPRFGGMCGEFSFYLARSQEFGNYCLFFFFFPKKNN